MMPAMDGFAAVHAIKREPGPFVPVILLTALDDPASRAKGINAGADEILAKPVHPFELRLRCRAMLRIHQLTEELHAANRRLRALARTDELTDVRNRRGLRSALTREFRRAERYGGALTVMAFDVDRFKQVNDDHGHAVGDQVLHAVAQGAQARRARGRHRRRASAARSSSCWRRRRRRATRAGRRALAPRRWRSAW